MKETFQSKKWSWIVFFTSLGTLICCAIPILLVSLGFGAVIAALFSNLPFLVTLAKSKSWLFLITAGILVISIWLLYRPEQSCPTDPAHAKLCQKTKRFNKKLVWISVILWIIGFTASYLALPIMELLSK